MKVLHTSDLHIGKKLMGRERFWEYRAVFGELCSICRAEKVELLLIAGDVFDTYTPSAEAEEIFYSGVKSLAEICTVLVISGNHDDYVRLTAASALASALNVYILGNNLQKIPVSDSESGKANGFVKPVESDFGYVIMESPEGERVYVNALPYPNEARFKEERTEETFTEKMQRWIEYGERGNTQNLPSIFLSHIFVAGGAVSDSEREIDLGGARAVPLSMLPKNSYCALGHLHRRQKLGENAYYCGAPLRFTFDESGQKKSVNLFELTKEGVQNFQQIEITSGKELVRLQANSVAAGLEVLSQNAEAFAELTLNLSGPLTPDESAELRASENLVSLKTEILNLPEQNKTFSNKEKSSSELFGEYYLSRYGSEAPRELLELFLSLTEEE